MKATVLDPAGKPLTPLMGCYGIGVTRVVAAAIEQNHDEKGIVWPEPIAPFTVMLVTLNHARSEAVRDAGRSPVRRTHGAGIDDAVSTIAMRVPGVKFADAELLGIPHCVVIGDRGIAAGRLEYRHRRTGANGEMTLAAVAGLLRSSPHSRAERRRARRGGCCGAARAALCLRLAARASSAIRSCAASSRRPSSRRECFPDKFDSAVWYTLMEPKLRRVVQGPRRAHADPQDRLLRGQPAGRAAPASRSHPGRHRRGKPLQPLGGIVGRRGGPDAGHAVLARANSACAGTS